MASGAALRGVAMGHRVVAWFSCGAASAVAAKMIADAYGNDAAIVNCDTLADEHPDNARFFADVERWIGRPIERIRSAAYSGVDDVIERRRYMSGVAGAPCTTQLKKLPREAWQRIDDVHVFGYTAEESDRAAEFEERNPSLRVLWPLIDSAVTKADCLALLDRAGIALPAMYLLGYDHNNCLGCVKAQSPRYWNAIRRDFPATFAKRANQSRVIGARLVKLHGNRIFLDELPPDADGPRESIDCGPVCQGAIDFGFPSIGGRR